MHSGKDNEDKTKPGEYERIKTLLESCDINDLHNVIKIIQNIVVELESQGVDVTSEANKLSDADKKLSVTNPQDIPDARSNIVSALGSLIFKKKTFNQSKSFIGGVGVIISLGIIASALLAFIIYSGLYNQVRFDTILNSKILFVPVYVYVWGVIGTMAYSLWAGLTHIAHKDFDNYYIPWYFIRLPLGAMIAAIFYFVITAGFIQPIVASGGTSKLDVVDPFVVISFLSGFGVRYSINTLDKILQGIMNNTQDVKSKTNLE